ncbi:MAG: c-type cytochrome [Verrucomicrobiales bacterium]|nr:c-type cytochrome [Verrucomicrobiales bacterium]
MRIFLTPFILGVMGLTPFLHAEETEEERRERLHIYLKGRYVFQKQCAICHGATGRGDGEWAANLIHKPRNFRSGVFKFRSTPYGMLPTDEDLRRTIRNGISGTAMPFFKELSDDEVDSLIVYLQSLSREWNDDSLHAESIKIPELPKWYYSEKEKANHVKKGAERFAVSCVICHGATGDGDGPGGKGLVDVWGFPSQPAALSKEHHKSGDDPTDIYRTIATGLNGTAMIGFSDQFKTNEIWELVAYVQSLSEEKVRKTERAEE